MVAKLVHSVHGDSERGRERGGIYSRIHDQVFPIILTVEIVFFFLDFQE